MIYTNIFIIIYFIPYQIDQFKISGTSLWLGIKDFLLSDHQLDSLHLIEINSD